MTISFTKLGGTTSRPSLPPHPWYCLLGVTAFLCALLYILIRWFNSSPSKYLPWDNDRDYADRTISTTPFTDYINPDTLYLRRMFYSGALVKPDGWNNAVASAKSGTGAAKITPLSSTPNISVFHGEQGGRVNDDLCVPFHAPFNKTLKICIYEREKDNMVSAFLQDHGTWEKEQLEGMAELLLRDDLYIEREKERRSVGSNDILVKSIHRNSKDYTRHRRSFGYTDSSRRDAESEAEMQRLSVVDVGCNVGVYTLTAASLGHPVLAVDPVRSSLHLLDTSLRLAGVRTSTTLLLNALTDRPGPVKVRVHPTNKGGSSVLSLRGKKQTNMTTVWAVCLDHLVTLVPTNRVFLKLDIEGWERRVLRCGGEFFQRLDVRVVLMEWLFLRHQRAGAEVLDFMVRNGLLPYSEVPGGKMLNPEEYYSWPDNVWWMKR